MKQDTKWKIGTAIFWCGLLALALIINCLYGCTRTIESGADIVTGKVMPDTLVGPPLSDSLKGGESDGGDSGDALPIAVTTDTQSRAEGEGEPGPSLSFPWEKFDLIAFASAGIYAQQKSLTDEWLNIQYPSNAGVMTTLVYGRFFPGRDWGHHTKFYFFGLTDWTIYAVAREDSATSARMAWTDYKTIPWGIE